MSEKLFESYQCKLEVLSPLHIGTGSDLSPFDYFVDGDRVVVYNLQKLLSEDKAFAERLAAQSERFRSERDFFLANILNPRQKRDENYHFYSLRVNDTVKRELQRLGSRGNKANINCCIKNGDGLPYVPGSSLKGAIRTAYAYYVLKRENRLKEQLLNDLERKSRNKKPRNKVDVERIVFRSSEGTRGDIFRAIRISDSLPVEGPMAVESIRRLSRSSDQRKIDSLWQRVVNLYETVSRGAKTFFTLTLCQALQQRSGKDLKWELLERYPLSKEHIVNYCREFYTDLLKWEKNYFDCYPSKDKVKNIAGFYARLGDMNLGKFETLLRIGQGGGFYGKTVAMLLFTWLAEEGKFPWFVRKFGKRTQASDPAKASKVVVDSDPEAPVLGWVKVTFDVKEA